jgi:hypothetical protein
MCLAPWSWSGAGKTGAEQSQTPPYFIIILWQCYSKEWSLSIEGIIKEHIEGLSFCHQCWIDQLEQYTLAL